VEAACLSGAAHLLSFRGTDTIPAINFLEEYYSAPKYSGEVGCSVAATEHSVMCAGTPDMELSTYRRLIKDVYPSGILSIVSDQYDLWKVLTNYIQDLRSDILSRNGKIVFRPDSGDPIKILCGDSFRSGPAAKGVIELLWDCFGGKVNSKGYRELDSHVGAIYGDSISLDRAKQICTLLKKKGFASTNVVFGIGSFTYQYNTRDTFGFAVKSTYTECSTMDGTECVDIYKDPVTDDGVKKSAMGLLVVKKNENGFYLKENASWAEERADSELTTVFYNSKLVKSWSYSEIVDQIKMDK
jgi:nicotinamide phosphoribosyltransferase